MPGTALLRASWIGTAVFAMTAVGAALFPGSLDIAALVVSLGLFFVGIVLFVWAYAIAVGRSRRDEIDVVGLWLLSGSAPRRVRAVLFGSLCAEIVVALATAAARRFSPLIFGVLAPMYGLGAAGFWAARHGSFPARRINP